jgi:hypothetical protein
MNGALSLAARRDLPRQNACQQPYLGRRVDHVRAAQQTQRHGGLAQGQGVHGLAGDLTCLQFQFQRLLEFGPATAAGIGTIEQGST